MHSDPPEMAASTLPLWIARRASPAACAEEVQAVWNVQLEPVIPYLFATKAVTYCGNNRKTNLPFTLLQYSRTYEATGISEPFSVRHL
jgi:hypothetical protein